MGFVFDYLLFYHATWRATAAAPPVAKHQRLLQIPPENPILDRHHPLQPTGYHGLLVGLPGLLPPSPPKKIKTKERKAFCPPRVGASHFPPPLRRGLEPRFRLPRPPHPVAGASEGVSSGVEGAAAPRTLHAGDGDLHPKSSASRPSRWCPPI